MTRMRLTASACFALLMVAGLAMSSRGPTASVTVGVFEAPDSIEAATSFAGNDLVFEARVTGRMEARMTRPDDGDGLAVAYTPINAMVTRVLKGDLKPGTAVTIRSLGGTVGGTEYTFEGAVPADRYAIGSDVLLFAEPLLDSGDGAIATTPNWVFLVANGRIASGLDRRDLGAVEAVRTAVDPES